MPNKHGNAEQSLARSRLLPSYRVLDTHDLDEAIALTSGTIGDCRAEPLGKPSRFHVRVHHAPFSNASVAHVDAYARLSLRCSPQKGFRVFLGLRGALEHLRGRDTFISGRDLGTIHSPRTELHVRTEPTEQLIVTLPEDALVREASRRQDARVDALELAPQLELRKGPGAAFVRMVHFVANELEHSSGCADSGTMIHVETALAGLLLDAQPPMGSKDAPAAVAGPAVVRRVDEMIHNELDRPLTVGDLAFAAGVSARTLFRTYRRYRGRSPIKTLREVRLARVRRELLAGKPGTTVTQAAVLCGFTHLGRFSEIYRRCFGETPSSTLRRAQSPGASFVRGGMLATR